MFTFENSTLPNSITGNSYYLVKYSDGRTFGELIIRDGDWYVRLHRNTLIITDEQFAAIAEFAKSPYEETEA